MKTKMSSTVEVAPVSVPATCASSSSSVSIVSNTSSEECAMPSMSESERSEPSPHIRAANTYNNRRPGNYQNHTSNNGGASSSRGHYHNYNNHNQYNNGYHNQRYHNKTNYYHHGGNYHHQNNRRYNNYHHYQNGNTYNSFNNNHYNPYFGSSHFYNNYSYPHPTFNLPSSSLPQSQSAVVPAPVTRSQTPAPISSNGHGPAPSPPPSLPLKLNTFMDYWPSTSTLSDQGEVDSFTSEGPSSIDSQGSSSSYFSFQPRRPYNGFNPATKPPTGYELAGKANSALTTWSSNVIIPAHIKLPEGSKLDKEYEITQRGKFYIDGFPSLAAHKVDPDELVKSFKFGEMLEKPLGLLADTTTLSDEIWEKFKANQQTTDTFRKKMELWSDMAQALRRHYRHYGLQVVGSTMSGFGSNSSDVDMCLLVRRVEIDQQSEAVDFLHQFWAAMGSPSFLDKIEMVYAKIPLLKCRDSVRNLEVDLNCNNYVGIRNTQLLYFYAQQDWRLKPLALVVKLWAKFHDINDAKAMTISSYSLVLMVIHFLQCGVHPPVLPCLHKVFPEKFMFQPDILEVKQYINETIRTEPSKNTQSLGDLLVKFFEYYAIKFDYKTSAISVRQGEAVTIKSCQANKAGKNDPHQWKQLCIEEPFDYTNTARSVYDRDTFDRIRGIFFASWQRIYLSRELKSIFSPIAHYEAREIGVRIRS